ncbi:MAG: sigma-70 family RNA polymerase sigma factor [Verrucomicrobiae bacterium]|nr:sigma-70 family RNA polymerase sigma factor [Verrucomicrobiae bacterium]
MATPSPDLATDAPRIFATTLWGMVRSAGEGHDASTRPALEDLCRVYWRPIYIYVRRKGHGPEDAQDLTQQFLSQLITGDQLRQADPAKGRFRTFLLSRLDSFLAREWQRARRQKRGGQFTFIPLNTTHVDDHLARQSARADDAGTSYLREWALTLLKQALDALRQEYEMAGKREFFQAARSLLSGQEAPAYPGLSRQLKMSEGALRVAVHRLRRRYGELLRVEVTRTVASPREVDEEMRCLMRALGEP